MIVMIQPSALEDNFLCSLKVGHFRGSIQRTASPVLGPYDIMNFLNSSGGHARLLIVPALYSIGEDLNGASTIMFPLSS